MYYTKYRPQTFSEISEPNEVAQALSNQIKSGKTVHAYMFVGPRGTGKTTMARILAKALNCLNIKDNGDPCSTCENCIAIKNGTFLDLVEIDAASNRGIDDIRILKEKIKLAPAAGKHKVYIVDEVHMLTTEAFNALLKTLEEPPANVTFILCTTEFHKVPETIRSRCQVFKFKRASVKQIVAKLEKIINEEKVTLDKQTLTTIARASHGGFRDAETLLQQVAEGEVSVDALLNLSSLEAYASFVDLLAKKDIKQLLHEVNKVYEDGMDLYVWVGELLKYLRDLMFVSSGASNEVIELSDEINASMKVQTECMTSLDIAKLIELLIKAQNNVKSSFIPQLPIEVALIKYIENSSDPKTPKAPSVRSPAPTVVETKKVEKTESIEVTLKEDEEGNTEVEIVEESSSTTTEATVVGLDEVTGKWKVIVREVATVNTGISALLKAAKPVDINGRKIILEVPYDFYKERLLTEKNRRIVEGAIETVFENSLIYTCVVNKPPVKKKSQKETGKLTDYNVLVPSGSSGDDAKNIVDVFDGSLPF